MEADQDWNFINLAGRQLKLTLYEQFNSSIKLIVKSFGPFRNETVILQMIQH